MKTYEIWSEGYRVSGHESGAIYMGRSRGSSFETACVNYFSNKPKSNREYFNPEFLTYWGCKLYDNEADAKEIIWIEKR